MPLIVPVQVEAFLVNHRVRVNEPIRRWQPDLARLDRRYPPEPDPLYQDPFEDDEDNNGVYLHWLLPDALRRGRQDGPAGRVEFPLVPNRWLVVRYSRPADRPDQVPASVGWVVDSDFLDMDATTPFLDPRQPGVEPIWIGRNHNLTDGEWTERTGYEPFLTAIGPGLPTFAVFQPYNEDVFSLHDPLTDLDGPALLSYLVVGWYSDPTWDVLHSPSGGDVRELLDSLRWATTDATARPTRSLYYGTALNLAWDVDGNRPEQDRKPLVRDVDLAVGHVSPDAETGLEEALLDDPETALLWEALRYDLLDVLDEDGEAALDQATHRTWFTAEQGGYTWRIVDRPGDWPPLSPEEAERERTWLGELNRAQAEFDAASRDLAAGQRRLYGLWWLRGQRNRPSGWDDLCDEQLKPDIEGTVAHAVDQDLALLFGDNGLRSRVPWGDTAEELATEVSTYARREGLTEGRELQRCAEPPFQRVPDPSIVIRGAKLDRPLTDEKALPCREREEIVTGIRVGENIVTPPTPVPAPPLTNLPEQVVLRALLDEFYLLDHAAVAGALEEAIANPGNVTGTLARFTVQWQQPWSPLLLVWRINCHPTPFSTEGTANWDFDGTHYTWSGENAVIDPTSVTGRSLLNPLPGFNTRARLLQHARTHPRGPVAALLSLREQADDWDLLSQPLNGVNRWLGRNTPATKLTPEGELTELVDTRDSRVVLSSVPDPGPTTAGDDGREFHPVRAAQFVFEEVYVVDRFGRSLAVIDADNVTQKPPQRAESVTPNRTVGGTDPLRWVELPPRLIQPARLRLDFVSGLDDAELIDVEAGPGAAGGATPVCGWLLANHLTGSLLVHAPDGRGLGEIRIVLDTAHRRVADWDPLPGSPYPELDDERFAEELPHLHGFATELVAGGETAFTEFLSTVDVSMGTTAPGGDDHTLAALVGRPMALLRTRLRIELDGPPISSGRWNDLITPPPPEFTDYAWNVRLGAADMLRDGLAGFFAGTDYRRLYTVPAEQASGSGYTTPITGTEFALTARPTGRAADEDGSAWATLLADPWASVHAVTDILPVGELRLPPTWVRDPLARIKLSFRVGPLLAGSRGVPDRDGEPTEHVVMPGPSGWRGEWSLAEPAPDGEWATRPLATPDPALALTDTTPVARTGFLQLSNALGEIPGSLE
ncbi:hypothetical protein [Allokutzneria albata]|uniref:Uncharacterized protein n=1 Tax=Allokutzneria albata TaxID=211114 RepID=A0A1G9S7Z3_ALLAB|nr:hypothetical protein [Allokutzneria albata]SDM31427.1 hypothetical protein SAMN04489726_0946 [Allokutzneria albata]